MPKNGPSFDVESASVHSIYANYGSSHGDISKLTIEGDFSRLGEDARVGTVSLYNLYEFLKNYRTETQDLDRLYERNVRRWLGMNKNQRVNHAIKTTLEQEPERFGRYNNGITFVATRFVKEADSSDWLIEDPFVVKRLPNDANRIRSLGSTVGFRRDRSRRGTYRMGEEDSEQFRSRQGSDL